jgi:hypothetical protein
MVCPICGAPVIMDEAESGKVFQYCSVDECPYSEYLPGDPNADLEF